ncbi:FAD/NAD(P)-binding domain-containing protein [Penicillium bovifimosum]|uniref:FAD/NAD(P)-binding domain-containing protein n=1 Tax=Penicillium bovifimosum TaxID=126998 RepID=A0A9W9KWZ9_9EURO|nr:FAD/NAD(P)-binding domain-containing protein [Penicillium bovifimosum]KAJ5124077.1 FAD/NAD(P)-binding domain-containing protein [Penicillium bovifimosum]
MHVLIVGGGLGGLSLAQCLRKQGISFEVFERDANSQSRPQGWAIAIHSIIDQLAEAFPSDMPDLKEATNHLAPLKLPAQIGLYFPNREGRLGVQDSPELPIVRSERRRLRDWLSTNIPIQWNKRVSKIQSDDDGVTVFFEDGTSAKGDILVGADGIKSVVRENLTQRTSDEMLKLVPIAAIVGELDLSGEAFKRQLALGHSAYIFVSPDLGFWNFGGLHHVHPDGVSGRHYWMYMEPDPNVAEPNHWLQTATREEKLNYVLKKVSKMPPKFREIFESTPASGIKEEPHIWRDLELESLPAGRVILVGDAAHAMTPFRGEGGYHTFIDCLELSRILGKIDSTDIAAVKEAVAGYNAEMLERGVEAVRNSRGEQGDRKAQDRKSKVVSAMQEAKPLPESEIVLEAMA